MAELTPMLPCLPAADNPLEFWIYLGQVEEGCMDLTLLDRRHVPSAVWKDKEHRMLQH